MTSKGFLIVGQRLTSTRRRFKTRWQASRDFMGICRNSLRCNNLREFLNLARQRRNFVVNTTIQQSDFGFGLLSSMVWLPEHLTDYPRVYPVHVPRNARMLHGVRQSHTVNFDLAFLTFGPILKNLERTLRI